MNINEITEIYTKSLELYTKSKKYWTNYETMYNAYELCHKSASLYKLNKYYTNAAIAFVSCGKISCDMKDDFAETENYNDAFVCYDKCNDEKALEILDILYDLYCKKYETNKMGAIRLKIAECFAKHNYAYTDIIFEYKSAIALFDFDDTKIQKCQLEIATLETNNEVYENAIVIYENLANKYGSSTLGKYVVNSYLYKSLICSIAHDIVLAIKNIEKYKNEFPTFEKSREYMLISDLLDSIGENNVDSFTLALSNYDKLTVFDDWSCKILLKIKKNIFENMDLT